MQYLRFAWTSTFLVGCSIAASGQAQTDVDALATRLSERLYDQCMQRPVIAAIRSGIGAFSYDTARECACIRAAVKPALTPEFVARDSAAEGQALRAKIISECRAKEFAQAYVRDCVSLAQRTPVFNVLRPKAGSPENYCKCVTSKIPDIPWSNLVRAAEDSLQSINDYRSIQGGGVNLDTIYLDKSIDASCGGRRENQSSGQPPASRADPFTLPSSQPEQTTRKTDDSGALDESLNAIFKQWARQWMFDRYVPSSAHVLQQRCNGANCSTKGTFQFRRQGQLLTIPFDADIEKSPEGTFSVSRLCYDDTTSGVRECF